MRHKSTVTRAVLVCCLATVLGILIGLAIPSKGMAQTAGLPSPTADVVIDGRVLFRLGSIDGFTAQRRAASANSDLKEAVQTTPLDRPIPVNLAERDQLTTIRVNNRHLLTVTDGDFLMGVTPQEQATEWTQILRDSLAQAQKERLPSYIQAMVWRILIGLFVVGLLNVLIFRIRKQIRRRWAKQSDRLARHDHRRRRLVQPTLLGVQGMITLGFLIYACELLPRARTVRYQTFQFLSNAFNSPLLTSEDKSYSLLDISRLIVLVLLLWLVVRGLTALVKVRFLQATIPDRGVQDAIATLMQFTLMALGIFILLQAWGIDLSALAIFASVLGVGLGFGLQNIANNFISGWILLIERPMQVGDLINLGDVFGSVERIGGRSTELKTADGFSIIVPNSELVQNRVINWSHGHPVSRVRLPLCVAHDSDIDQVHNSAVEAALAHPEVLRYPQPQLRFSKFGENALHFELLLWIRNPRHQFDVKSDVYYLLQANFKRYQIHIPFPQRDLHLRSPELQALVKQGFNNFSEEFSSDPFESSSSDFHEDSFTSTRQPSVAAATQSRGAFPPSLMANVIRYSAILKTPTHVAATEVDRLVEQMLGPEGLEIRDRKFHLTHYSKCFIGSEAVNWIVKTQKATHQEAVRLGQLLIDRGIIHHVIDEHGFKDEYLFYRFYCDEM